MPSRNNYCLTWVSLTLEEEYLLTAAPPDLGRGVAPLSPPAPAQPPPLTHASKVMLKILQARLKQYVNHELPEVQAGFIQGRGTRDKIANIFGIIRKAREFQESIYLCFIDYAKAFDCVNHNKLWKILKEMGIPDHLTCLLRNLCASQ